MPPPPTLPPSRPSSSSLNAPRARSSTLQAAHFTSSKSSTSSLVSSLLSKTSKSSAGTTSRPSRTQTLKNILTHKVLGRPKPESAEGWVIRPDLLFDMQVAGRGGSAREVMGRCSGEGLFDAKAARVGGERVSSGSGRVVVVEDVERVVGRQGGDGGRKARLGDGRKIPETFAEMEALMYY